MRRLLFKSLVHGPLTEAAPPRDDAAVAELAAQVNRAARRRLGRTLSIREVDAGSCNGCELEIHALNNVLYDLERFGMRFVASPRHADVLLVTGPVTTNMREALERTYQATPHPKWVVAVGDCARDGGVFSGSYACVGGVGASCPSTCTSAAARRRRSVCSKVCSHCSSASTPRWPPALPRKRACRQDPLHRDRQVVVISRQEPPDRAFGNHDHQKN